MWSASIESSGSEVEGTTQKGFGGRGSGISFADGGLGLVLLEVVTFPASGCDGSEDDAGRELNVTGAVWG